MGAEGSIAEVSVISGRRRSHSDRVDRARQEERSGGRAGLSRLCVRTHGGRGEDACTRGLGRFAAVVASPHSFIYDFKRMNSPFWHSRLSVSGVKWPFATCYIVGTRVK